MTKLQIINTFCFGYFAPVFEELLRFKFITKQNPALRQGLLLSTISG